MTDDEERDPIAAWKAVFRPKWEWEAYRKESEGVYFGRVRSPNTNGCWEYGQFTQTQLSKVGAYRTDIDSDDDAELFPESRISEETSCKKPGKPTHRSESAGGDNE